MHSRQADHDLARSQALPLRARSYLQAVSSRLPAMRSALDEQGGKSLRDYVRTLSRPGTSNAPQGHEDLVRCVHRQCASLLGDDAARRAADSLTARPTVLTANHHGVDFFAQSVQGSLALAVDAGGADGAVVVLACGGVPLNNLTYPRGMLAYLHTGEGAGQGPFRLPVFPDRLKRSMVCTTPHMDAPMIRRARDRLHKMQASSRVAHGVVPTMDTILEQDYAAREVLACERYSDQATILNHRIWKRLFADPGSAPALAYLELETVSADLLADDLNDDSTLAWMTLFHSEIREQVLTLLDAERACWNRAALARRNLATGAERSTVGATGTVFFWALDARNRRIPLTLTTTAEGTTHLQGVADDGEHFSVRFHPTDIIDALKSRRLLPSLFLSYLCIAMARGVSCLGGYYQAQYLPAMHAAVVKALQASAGAQDMARRVTSSVPDAYLSGMQAVCTRNRAGGLVPAGPIEIVAAGGLSPDEMEKMAQLRVDDAHLASIVDTLMDAGRDLVDDGPWHLELNRELWAALADKVVVVSADC